MEQGVDGPNVESIDVFIGILIGKEHVTADVGDVVGGKEVGVVGTQSPRIDGGSVEAYTIESSSESIPSLYLAGDHFQGLGTL
jgi:hypothetical protein